MTTHAVLPVPVNRATAPHGRIRRRSDRLRPALLTVSADGSPYGVGGSTAGTRSFEASLVAHPPRTQT
jgi:hypothetical protein